MSRFSKVIAAMSLVVLIAGPAAGVEREHIGRYSTPEMADPVVRVRAARGEPGIIATPVDVAPVVGEPGIIATPVDVAPVVGEPELVPVARQQPVPAEREPEPAPPAPAPGTPIVDDPDAGPYSYDPEQPNEGRPNGAGGWEPGPADG